MDVWHYYDVTHAGHVFCNPISEHVIDEVGRIVGLRKDTRVLDIACGHGELLVRFTEHYGIIGTGIDISPYALARAEQRRDARVPGSDLRLIHVAGQDYATEERFDVVSCVGASWIWGGYTGTLRAMKGFAARGGHLVIGEPYWKREPPAAYLEADGLQREQFHTLEGCRDRALAEGLRLVWMSGASEQDWDRYEMTQTAGVEAFAREHPHHPDLPDIRTRRTREDAIYVRWGREHCGFALWVFAT